MRCFDISGLASNDREGVDGEASGLDGFAVFGDCGIFSALALRKDGMLVAGSEDGLEVNPAAVQSPSDGAFGFRGADPGRE